MPAKTTVQPVVLLVASEEGAWGVLSAAADLLDQFGVPWERAAEPGEAPENGRRVEAIIVASSDGFLPARWSRGTGLPTIRVPAGDGVSAGLALLRDGEGDLPAGPDGGVFATMAIGAAGAKNAALFAVAALALRDDSLRAKWRGFRDRQTAAVLAEANPTLAGSPPVS